MSPTNQFPLAFRDAGSLHNAPRPALPPTPAQFATPRIYRPSGVQNSMASPPVYRPADVRNSVSAPPVYHPQSVIARSPNHIQAVSPAIQRAMPPAPALIASEAVQMAKCNCGKPGNKHKSDCPRNPNRLRVDRQQQQQRNRRNNTIRNINTYAPDQADRATAFVNAGGVVRGHRRGNQNSGRQGVTNRDVAAVRNFNG